MDFAGCSLQSHDQRRQVAVGGCRSDLPRQVAQRRHLARRRRRTAAAEVPPVFRHRLDQPGVDGLVADLLATRAALLVQPAVCRATPACRQSARLSQDAQLQRLPRPPVVAVPVHALRGAVEHRQLHHRQRHQHLGLARSDRRRPVHWSATVGSLVFRLRLSHHAFRRL